MKVVVKEQTKDNLTFTKKIAKVFIVPSHWIIISITSIDIVVGVGKV
jgi:hypothetical protein